MDKDLGTGQGPGLLVWDSAQSGKGWCGVRAPCTPSRPCLCRQAVSCCFGSCPAQDPVPPTFEVLCRGSQGRLAWSPGREAAGPGGQCESLLGVWSAGVSSSGCT